MQALRPLTCSFKQPGSHPGDKPENPFVSSRTVSGLNRMPATRSAMEKRACQAASWLEVMKTVPLRQLI